MSVTAPGYFAPVSVSSRPRLRWPQVRTELPPAAFKAVLLVCWTLPLACLNLHDHRLAPYYFTFDATTIAKVLSRMAATIVVGYILLRHGHQPGFRKLWVTIFPWLLFGLWATTSVLWSPLKPLTAGHGAEVVLLSLIAAITGMVCTNEERLSKLFLSMTLVGLLMTLVLFVFYRDIVFNPSVLLHAARPGGVLEANAMGGISGVYLLLLVGSALIGRWKWPKRLLVPGILIHGLSMYVAHSRGALVVTLLMMFVLVLMVNRSLAILVVISLIAVFAAAFPLLSDPGKMGDSVTSYFMRGQTADVMLHGSGRGELWTQGVASFVDAPWFGHGYFVMSDSGFLQVWRAEQWQTAHNLFLHVATGTGILGLVPFIWALCAVLSAALRQLRDTGVRGKLARITLVIFGYWITTGFLELSFLGPVNPATLLFYVCIGLAAGLYQFDKGNGRNYITL
jgi:O-antigen ligase